MDGVERPKHVPVVVAIAEHGEHHDDDVEARSPRSMSRMSL